MCIRDSNNTGDIQYSYHSTSTMGEAPLVSVTSTEPLGVKDTYLRWVTFLLCALQIFLHLIVYFLPQGVQRELEIDVGLDDFQYNLMYSAYALPNLVMPFYIGRAVDEYGAPQVYPFVIVGILIGYSIFLFGLYMKSFTVIILGRFVQGLSGDSVYICVKTILSKWFLGNRFTFVVSLLHFISRTAVMIATTGSPRAINVNKSVIMTLSLGLCCVFIMLLSSLFIRYMATKKRIIESKYKVGIEQTGSILPEDELSITQHLMSFKLAFWLVASLICLTLSVFYGFLTIANRFLQVKYEMSSIEASNFIAMALVFSLPGPFIGYLADRKGQRTLLMLTGFSCGGACFILMAGDNGGNPGWTLRIALILFGCLDLLCASVMYALVPYTVRRDQIGLAYGASSAMLNLGILVLPVIIGLEHEWIGNEVLAYSINAWTYAITCGVGVVMAILLRIMSSGAPIDKPDTHNDQPQNSTIG
eukprot:TRINITY_DN3529_c0_g1_i1.p1 TRINITY_DN3529_c0_g1~~TRINITY_DN3529_c0_g1_i1.p1  ORF type:complete len:494 (-),score=90.72 TRINITY_DN3529_c0_g1_i1:147-1568(-)